METTKRSSLGIYVRFRWKSGEVVVNFTDWGLYTREICEQVAAIKMGWAQ